MRTIVRVQNANCPEFLNAVRDELFARPLVHDVHMSAASGCLEVDHDDDDLAVLAELLGRGLRGWEVASNGEIVQVTTDAELSHVCAVSLPGRLDVGHGDPRREDEVGG